MKTSDAVEAVRAVLGPHHLCAAHQASRPADASASWMCCYMASEAVQVLADELLTPATVRVEGVVHWYLRDADGLVVDPTADQFLELPNYGLGQGRGFLTKKPSKYTQGVLAEIGANS